MSAPEPAVPASVTPATPVVRAPRTRKGWDIGLSIALLVCSVIVYAVGAVIAYFALAFFGSCGDHGCSGEGVTFAFYALPWLIGVGILGTVVFLIVKLRGWWFAAPTLALVLLGWFASIVIAP